MTRYKVLREFKLDDVFIVDMQNIYRMADEIVWMREQLAASEPVSCRCGKCADLGLVDVDLSEKAHPSAAAVTVTEAMVEAFSLAYRLCEETHEPTFTHNMGIKAGLTAALTHPTTPTRGSDE